MKMKTIKYAAIIFTLFLMGVFNSSFACCDPDGPVEVPACFLIDNDPKIMTSITDAQLIVTELKNDFTSASMIVDDIEGLVGESNELTDAIRAKAKEGRKNYNDLRIKLGAKRGAGDGKEPGESTLIAKLREVFDKYNVKEDGEFKPKLEEAKEILNTLARTANIMRAQVRRLRFEETRTSFRAVDKVADELLDKLDQAVSNINLSINEGVCLWEVIKDEKSPTDIKPASDVNKKRLKVGTEVRSPAKQREVKNDLNSKLVEADGRVADPDNCLFHHTHGTIKGKEDPDGDNCGHGSVDNTDLECPNCPALQIERVTVPESGSDSECVLFIEPEDGMSATRDPRREYEDWVKQLLCTYVETDFSNPSNIEGFASAAFAAFRANTPSGITSSMNIIHIVARNPAVINKKGKPQKVKSLTIKRSINDTSKSAVGLTRFAKGKKVKLFGPSKPAKNEAEQVKLFPTAENAITYLFLLAKASDVFAGSMADELTGATVSGQVATATKAFNSEFLPASKVRILTPIFDPGNPTPPDTSSTSGGGGEAVTMLSADSFFQEVPISPIRLKVMGMSQTFSEFKANEIPAGTPLGVTVPITTVRKPITVVKSNFDVDGLESVEPFEKFKPKKIVKVVVRTFIHMFVANGRPVFRKANSKGKTTGKPTFDCTGSCIPVQGVKVISNDGQRDLTSLIQTHEKKHVDDTFAAWKEQVIDQIVAQLNSSALDSTVTDRTVELVVRSVGGKQNAVDIEALYLLGDKGNTGTFKKEVLNLLTKNIIDGFRQNFKVEKDKKSDAFHATPEGMGLSGEEGVTVDGKPLDPVGGSVGVPPR